MLDQATKEQVSKEMSSLANAVKLIVFTQKNECRYCEDVRHIAEELSSTSDKLEVEVHDFVEEKGLADSYGIDKIPAIAVIGEKDHGIRFFGLPGGYEFTSLVEAIKAVGTGENVISADSMASLKQLAGPVNIQVFVTPT